MTAQEGADIYYTLDGSNPVYSKQKYTGPLNLAPGSYIRAVAAYHLNGSRSAEVSYVTSTAPVLEHVTVEVRDGKVHMNNPNEGMDLRISIDGTSVNGDSSLYTEPLDLFAGELRYRVMGPGVTGPEVSIYVTMNGNLFRDVPTVE